ncbi:helix-turn-helix domain-containing protein [Methanotorris formicicus]|uniref:Transposase n=2 Tax=Methanotorris formicicus TaxID=213185 RepID=H1L1R7_9EURY|nr:helix-turn-helix domain-containing protein [Methanotorris formicicus]EHP83212.1 transposase [Methanotorris formicicus Mc-S-70]
MRKKIDEPERLKRFIENKHIKSEEFRALVLLLVDKYKDVDEVSKITGVPSNTIYNWINEWNEKRKFFNAK